ncbi:MAG: hypothetical protein R3B57_12385 [Phycisphaerales bacterium]
MLLKVIDTKGKTRWINAAYVKSLKSKGGVTEIEVAGWNSTVRVAHEMDEVAAVINQAMTEFGAPLGALEEQANAQAGAQAAVIGVVLGG